MGSIWSGIFDKDTGSYAGGTASSSPDHCLPVTGTYANAAGCPIVPTSSSGSESVTFTLQLYSVKTYGLTIFVAIADSSVNVIQEATSKQDFSITVSNMVSLNVHAQSPVVVTLDGAPQSPGNVFVTLSPGSHTISAPSMVQVDNSTRLRFDHWEDGSTSTTRILNLQDDTTLTANYITQYRLTLVSNEGIATGSDWYDSGAVASFSVPSRYEVIWVFQGWYEGTSLVASSSSGSISMNAPHALVARWGPDYIVIGGIIGVILGVVIGVAYFGGKLPFLTKPSRKRTRRRQAKRIQTVSEPAIERATVTQTKSTAQETVKPRANEKAATFCTQCGAKMTRDSKFCKECGAKLA